MKKRAAYLLITLALFASGLFYLYAGNEVGPAPAASLPTLSQPMVRAATAASRQVAEHDAQTASTGTQATPSAAPPPPAKPALEPEIREALKDLLNTSSEGLEVEERDGVRTINLRGRFRTAPVATINERGEAEIQDYSWLPAE